MCGLGEKMKNKPNEERISRKAAALQWTGNNTQAVMDRLAQHGMIGELFRDIYIQVYKDGSYSDTLNIGDWLVEGEDGKLRLYTDETHALMYRPIDNELELLRAFARKIISEAILGYKTINENYILDSAGSHKLVATHFPSEPCGEICACREKYGDVDFDLIGVECVRLDESLKAHE